jgi:RNA polymerase sigma-70 factor (ECF subfamily)
VESRQNEIVDKCLKGDRRAQQQLYQQYSRAMYNICLRMMNDPYEAEDLMQISFVDVFIKLHTFKGKSTIGAWIKRIVINNCINELRKRKLHFMEMDGELGNIPDERVEEEPAYTIESVRASIQKLPDGFRTVLSLYLLEGYDHKEIAEILSITESTSKSQYHRAKSKLKEIIRANG